MEECWTRSPKFDKPMFIISSISEAYYKPEYYDKLSAELRMVSEMLESINSGLSIQKIKQEYENIDSFKMLSIWINYLK